MPRANKPEGGLLDSWGRRNRKHADRSCETCGSTFRPQHKSSRFCSRPCMWSKNGGQNKKPETWWKSTKGYINGRIWIDGKQKHVKQHRLVMERHLGRELLLGEDVHHISGDKADNRIENLQLISHADHAALSNGGRSYSRGKKLNLSPEERRRRSEQMKQMRARATIAKAEGRT